MPPADTSTARQVDAAALLEAITYQGLVTGYTHNFYRYPGRFSPRFARGVIQAFTKPGDVVCDPFMGGATSLVEARALGRHAIGCDLSSLSAFLGRVKTTPLGEDDISKVVEWTDDLPEHLNLHLPPIRDEERVRLGYQKSLPWPIRKSIELALARLPLLSKKRQQRFARCLVLKAGQWALDCRDKIPSAPQFRERLVDLLGEFVDGIREFRKATEDNQPPNRSSSLVISLHTKAEGLPGFSNEIAALPKKPTLVVTSPPYPGVYVLYHRWKVRGRKETPAPFWVANCHDGQGQAHYCMGERRQKGLTTYFDNIRTSFCGVRHVIDAKATVVQMVAFSEPEWQIPKFMEAMDAAGFEELTPESLGLPVADRLWREDPGRRWFALIQGALETSREVVQFHRPKEVEPITSPRRPC